MLPMASILWRLGHTRNNSTWKSLNSMFTNKSNLYPSVSCINSCVPHALVPISRIKNIVCVSPFFLLCLFAQCASPTHNCAAECPQRLPSRLLAVVFVRTSRRSRVVVLTRDLHRQSISLILVVLRRHPVLIYVPNQRALA